MKTNTGVFYEYKYIFEPKKSVEVITNLLIMLDKNENIDVSRVCQVFCVNSIKRFNVCSE